MPDPTRQKDDTPQGHERKKHTKKVYRFLKTLSRSIIGKSTRTKAKASAVMLALLPTSSLMAIEMNMLKTVATTTAGTQIFSPRELQNSRCQALRQGHRLSGRA